MPTRYVAHRGGAAQWPENSLTAFRNAIALGARVLELDVPLTAGGTVAGLHAPWPCPAPRRCRGFTIRRSTARGAATARWEAPRRPSSGAHGSEVRMAG